MDASDDNRRDLPTTTPTDTVGRADRAPARPGLRERYRRRRDAVRANPAADRAWRCVIGVLGGLIVVAGIIMIPYPGPGWLVVFTGLAVLATEFERARRVLVYARRHYDAWDAWQRRQHILVRLGLLLATCAVVLATLWLVDVLSLVAGWFGVEWPWLDSPLEPFA